MRPASYLVVSCSVLLLAGCTGAGSKAAPVSSTTPSSTAPSSAAASSTAPVSSTAGSSTALSALPGGGDETSSPAASRSTPAPVLTSPGQAAEVDGTCPYISAADFTAYEGDHVGRVTLIQTKPIGCRFYFYYQPTTAIVGEVSVQVFTGATPKIAGTNAFDAMVRASAGHPEVQSSTTIGDGAVAFKTMLQGANTWQCLVTVGNKVYTVRTRQPHPAKNAFNLAAEVVATVK